VVELIEARIGFHHCRIVGCEEALSDFRLLLGRKLRSAFARQTQVPICGAMIGVVDQLLQQGWHEIESLLDTGKLIKEQQHIEVVLAAVQAHPRHQVLPRLQVFVEGLMHVPDERYSHPAPGNHLVVFALVVNQKALFDHQDLGGSEFLGGSTLLLEVPEGLLSDGLIISLDSI
jgi:hypothetical protein